MKIDFDKRFFKAYNKLPIEIQKQWKRKIIQFFRDPYHPSLKNHSLKGRLARARSMAVNREYRAIYFMDGETCVFVFIGTHENVYKNADKFFITL